MRDAKDKEGQRTENDEKCTCLVTFLGPGVCLLKMPECLCIEINQSHDEKERQTGERRRGILLSCTWVPGMLIQDACLSVCCRFVTEYVVGTRIAKRIRQEKRRNHSSNGL